MANGTLMIHIILTLIAWIIGPFWIMGIILRVKALWTGRQGPCLLQPFWDFLKLLRKGEVISTSTSWIFQWAPIVFMISIIMASVWIPINHQAIVSFSGDIFLFVLITAVGKMMLALGAMDTGSSFEGMGVSRFMTFSSIAEPAFFLLLAGLTTLNGSSSFSGMMLLMHQTNAGLVSGLTALALFILLLVEAGRIPVNDPQTHLELTMIHEVMVLDYSGPSLAMIYYSHALMMMLLGTLIASLVTPMQLGWTSWIILASIITGLAVVIGTIESFFARIRMIHVPQFIFLITSLALTIISLVVFMHQGVLQ